MARSIGDFQRELQDAAKALEALDGELTNVSYDPLDPASVDAAVADVENAINARIAAYRGNEIVETLAAELKDKYRQQILDQAADAGLNRETAVSSANVDPTILRQIENVVTDLRSSEYQSFGKHIQKLSRVLHSPEIEPITRKLSDGIDLDAWLKAGESTQGSMVGSAKLDWPADTEKELGTVILLIDHFAAEPDQALQFAHRFYYNGNNVTANIQNMVRQVIVPFARDYIEYVKQQTGTVEPTLLAARSGPAARKVFIVHGHDEAAKQAVARYIEKLGFEPIILHERASRGRTIIEKIEDHGDVGFAVVLLRPDDVGGGKDKEQHPRARQNVILELGYFLGRLTRSRVCALQKGEVEVPSDFGGIVYTPFDDFGGWKVALAKELEAAGFVIDWNVAMRS